MSLFDALSKIAAHVEKQRPLIASEDDTILVSIQPFVRALGYDTQNLAEFKAQFSADAKTTGGEKVDYAILRDGKPIIFIEVKAAYISLNETHWKQLYNYFNADDVRFGVLSNGIEYRFFTDLKKRHIMDKVPFMTIDMLNLDEQLVKELAGLTKASFDPKRVVAGAKKRVIARLLKQEMNNPSDDIVRHLAKQVTTKRLSPDDLRYYAGLLGEAWRELVQPPDVAPPTPPPLPPPPDNEFVPVYGYHDGRKFEAELLRQSVIDGLTIAGHQIRYNGEMTWLKNAAVMAIRTVDPKFEPSRTFPNGFTFWHVIDPADGSGHMIRYVSGWEQTDEALRRRVLSS